MNLDACSITVTYNPDMALLRLQILNLVAQCRVIVVDNSEDQNVTNSVKQFCEELGIAVISMGYNAGIGAAQNQGIAHIKRAFTDVRFVLLLDQDSVPCENFVSVMKTEYLALDTQERVAAIGSALFDPRAGAYHSFHKLDGLRYRKVKPVDISDKPLRCTTVNSSGSFIPLCVLDEVGGFDEGFFIDHVETEWCFRVRSKGFDVFVTNKAELKHLMGDDVLTVSVFGWRKFMPYRSPLRHYYLFRNSLRLLGCHYVPIIWKIYCALKLVMTIVVFMIFSDERTRQLKMMGVGARDGIAGRVGRMI